MFNKKNYDNDTLENLDKEIKIILKVHLKKTSGLGNKNN